MLPICACFLIFIIVFRHNVTVESVEDFPSLISANATLAIVLDREYLGDDYGEILDSIKEYMKELAREKLKHGGVNVHYYSWSSIVLKNDVMAVLMVASCSDMWKAWANIKNERAALLAVTGADCARLPKGQGALAVPLPSKLGQELPQLALDLRTGGSMSWTSAVVLHDDTLNRDMVSRVAAALTLDSDDKTFSPLAISVFKMKHEETEDKRREEIAKTLNNLISAHTGERYLVIATAEVVTSVMEVAKSMQMVHPKAQWLYLISDTDYNNDNISSFASIMAEGENVAIIYNNSRSDETCKIGITCQAKELLKAFVLALDRAILEEMQVAAQVSDEEWEAIRKSKADRSISVVKDIEVYLAQNSECNNCITWRLRSADTWGISFQKQNNTAIDLLQVGTWRPVDGLTMEDYMFPHVIHGFRGRLLPIVSFHNPPWSILKINESGMVSEYSGLAFDIVNELAINLNFTYNVILPSDIKEEVGNETVDVGLDVYDTYMGQKQALEKILRIIESQGILLSATAFTVEESTSSRVNFTMPISVQPYAFLVSRPRALSRVLLFMSPFASDTWLCLGFAVVLMGPALFVVHKLSPFYEENFTKKRGGLANMHNCLWYMYGALLQQGGMYLPQADSGRLIVGTWWLVVLVVVTTYCGNLVAFLTFPRQDSPITTIRELLEHVPQLTWGVKSGTFLEECIKNTDEQKYKSLYSGAMLYKTATENVVENIRLGKHALFDWKINLQIIMKDAFIESDRCDFALSTEEFLEEQMAMVLVRNSPYLRMINDEIKRMHQVGLIQKWLAEYLPAKDRCWNVGKVAEVDNHTVNMDDMQGCFYVLFIGFSFASFVILIEYLLRRRQIKKDKGAIKPYAN